MIPKWSECDEEAMNFETVCYETSVIKVFCKPRHFIVSAPEVKQSTTRTLELPWSSRFDFTFAKFLNMRHRGEKRCTSKLGDVEFLTTDSTPSNSNVIVAIFSY